MKNVQGRTFFITTSHLNLRKLSKKCYAIRFADMTNHFLAGKADRLSVFRQPRMLCVGVVDSTGNLNRAFVFRDHAVFDEQRAGAVPFNLIFIVRNKEDGASGAFEGRF